MTCRTRRWFWGACDGLFTPRPLGPLFDIAAKLGGELLELCRADAPREDLFGALLRQISEPGGLQVMVVEDIHWADEATIDLLRFLGRRIRDANVLLIATYRDDGLSATDPLRLALGDLATQRSVRRVGLAPLSAAAVRMLAGEAALDCCRALPADRREPVLRDRGRAVRHGRGPRLGPRRGAGPGVPAEPGRPRVAGCRRADRHPGRGPPAGVGHGGPAAGGDELLASGLLAGDGVAVTFRHEIVRLAVAAAIPPLRCGLTHARILGALRDRGCDDDARLAFHAEGAGDGPAVLRSAPAAARRAARLGSHREAAAQFERALRFSGGLDAAAAAGLYDGLATEAGLVDRWEEAAGARQRALALWREAGDQRREGATLRQLSRPCGGCAAARSRAPRPRPPCRSSNRWARAPNWPGRT